ncbi:MAG TPA: hypothetical protein VMZ06_08430, partial [Candidatus Bathyarchaeia archaeon]|nr:hypothetical protein [Candidatus Bathyarchaeia archaeon]
MTEEMPCQVIAPKNLPDRREPDPPEVRACVEFVFGLVLNHQAPPEWLQRAHGLAFDAVTETLRQFLYRALNKHKKVLDGESAIRQAVHKAVEDYLEPLGDLEDIFTETHDAMA